MTVSRFSAYRWYHPSVHCGRHSQSKYNPYLSFNTALTTITFIICGLTLQTEWMSTRNNSDGLVKGAFTQSTSRLAANLFLIPFFTSCFYICSTCFCTYWNPKASFWSFLILAVSFSFWSWKDLRRSNSLILLSKFFIWF